MAGSCRNTWHGNILSRSTQCIGITLQWPVLQYGAVLPTARYSQSWRALCIILDELMVACKDNESAWGSASAMANVCLSKGHWWSRTIFRVSSNNPRSDIQFPDPVLLQQSSTRILHASPQANRRSSWSSVWNVSQTLPVALSGGSFDLDRTTVTATSVMRRFGDDESVDHNHA